MSARPDHPHRRSLVATAIRLSLFTIGWNLLSGGLTLAVSVVAAAAAALERRAEMAIAAAMLAVAIYLTAQASHSLATTSHAETSLAGLGVTIASLALLPWLARAKLWVAPSLPSRALRATRSSLAPRPPWRH